MEQRTLRLGDIVDDYCPRERRLTNHAIVAIVGDAVRQTRCSTCDTEHVYKGGQGPRRRRKDPVESAFEQVLNDVTGGQLVTPRPASEAEGDSASPALEAAPDRPAENAPDADPTAEASDERSNDFWPSNRPLIRATLPRTDADPPPPRPIPEFTMHQRQGRGGGFRHGGWPSGNGHGGSGFRPDRNGNDRQGSGFGGGRPGGGGGGGGRHRRRRGGGGGGGTGKPR
jgi:hypothetical protein